MAGVSGRGVVQAVEWDGAGRFFIRLQSGPDHPLAVTRLRLQRFGSVLWVLRAGTLQGTYHRLCAPPRQDTRLLRRFARALGRADRAIRAPGQA